MKAMRRKDSSSTEEKSHNKKVESSSPSPIKKKSSSKKKSSTKKKTTSSSSVPKKKSSSKKKSSTQKKTTSSSLPKKKSSSKKSSTKKKQVSSSSDSEILSDSEEISDSEASSSSEEENKRSTPPRTTKIESTPKKRKGKEFVLTDDQPRHLQAMLNILNFFKFCLDISPLGSGKTFTAMGVARALDLPYVIYVTNASLLPKPTRIFKEHGFDTRYFVTFETLRSASSKKMQLNKFRKLNHDLLRRMDTSHNKNKNIVSFRVTKTFKEFVKKGILVIFDEVQALKNASQQFLACMALEKYIIESNSKSVVLELSGSPGSVEHHFTNMMRRFQIIKHDSLYSGEGRNFNPDGAEDLRSFCNNLDDVKTTQIVGDGFTPKDIKEKAFRLYVEIVQKHISDSMPPPKSHSGVVLDIKNGFYRLRSKERKLIEIELKAFSKVVGFNPETQKLNKPIKRFFSGEITTGLVRIEVCKTNLFIRLAKQVLDINPKAKVCIALNYKVNIKNIAKALKKYGVLIVWGSDPATKKMVPAETRQGYIDKFNEPNTDKRVLIGTLSIISQGIDLDDRDGSYPRTAFESSSFFFTHCHQFTRRFLRGAYTRSSSDVRFVYVKCDVQEKSILNAMARQGDICKKTLEKQVEGGIKFPGEYEEEVEEKFEIEHGPYRIKDLLSTLYDMDEDDLN